MTGKQQIIATHDTLPPERSPMDALRKAIDRLVSGPPSIFIAIDALRPYPIRDLGPPDWLIVSASGDQPTFIHTDWRKVIEAAPQEAVVILLSQGDLSDIPRHVVQHVDLTGWHGDGADSRIDAVARLVAGGTSAWHREGWESDAIHRGALVHVGDGTTMLNPKLLTRISDLGLSRGTLRILRNQNMMYLGDLVQLTEAELLRIPSLGRTRLVEIKTGLEGLGLMLGATVPQWPPDDIEAAIEAAAAGPDPARTLARTLQAPAGVMFDDLDERLVIDPAAGNRSDHDVGASSVSTQLQDAIRRKLDALSPIAARLGNQTGWQDLTPLCRRLAELLDRPGAEIADVLGSLYGAALELGSYAEMDAAARNDRESTIDPLDPSAARPLQDVLTSMAPWLRRFPTIRELDDEGGRFLVAQSSAKASRETFSAAADTALIDDSDAALLRALLDAGDRGTFLGGKAGRRGLLSARNLVLAAATLVVGGMWDGAVSEYAGHSIIAHRAGAMLVKAENAVLEIAAEMPVDVRTAITRVMSRLHASKAPVTKQPR